MDDINFLQGITLLLIGLLFFRDEIIPWIKGKLGMKVDNSPATQGQVGELAEYVNHRQTEVLDRQTQLLEKQNSQLEAQTIIIADIKNGNEDVKRKLEEWERHGVPIKSR